MASNRANGTPPPTSSGPETTALSGQQDILIIREEMVQAAHSTQCEPESKITVEKIETDASENQPRGKIVMFPHNFSLQALEESAVQSAPSETESETEPSQISQPSLDAGTTLRRRGTLKQLLKRRAKKKELESFLRDRFKQMVLSELVGKKPETASLQPTIAEELPLAVTATFQAGEISAPKGANPQSTFKNSKGLKYRSVIQKAALEKAKKPSTREHLTAAPKKKTTRTKKKTAE